MSEQGKRQIDYTHKDYASLRTVMLELASEKLPEWTDHSPNDLGVLLLELFAYMGDQLFYYQDRIANESYLDTAVERRSVLHLLRLIGYELRPPQSASVELTLLFANDATDPVTITTGTTFQSTAAITGEPVSFGYIRTEPLEITPNTLLSITHTDGNRYRRYAGLPVVQVDAAVSDEIVGSSDGSAGQHFALHRSSLIDGTLELNVDEGAGFQLWLQQETLLYSEPNDQHFALRRDEKDITHVDFGDNLHGKIPRRGRNNIRATYRVGGGIKGNVPAHAITNAVTEIGGLELVFNPNAASGGADAEAIVEAAERGPKLFRTMGRAVTSNDYEVHAREFGVGKVRARAAGWNRIDLFVAPAGGGIPSDTLKEDLRTYFDDKRIMTSIVALHDPVYINVFIRGQLEVNPTYFTQEIQQRTEQAVLNLLLFDNVDFEDRIFLSKIYEAIEAIEGVRGVNISHFTKTLTPESESAAVDLPRDGTLRFGWNEIPIAGYGAGIRFDSVIGGRRDNPV